jgi:hypothetical protein
MYQARVDKLKMTYGDGNPAIQLQLSDLVSGNSCDENIYFNLYVLFYLFILFISP